MLTILRGSELYTSARRFRILHVAPESCLRDELAARPNVDYLTGDLLRDDVDIKGLDLTAIPFPDSSFDIVICAHVLEHILEDSVALREMHRVIAADGWALINGPSDPTLTNTYEDRTVTTREERLAHFGQEDHVRIYSQPDFIRRLQDAGFDVRVDPGVTTTQRRHYALSNENGYVHTYVCSRSAVVA
jgi:predicted SAM-dependent methyltransferase